MKQVSARQFRDTFSSLTEPVTVLRRTETGFNELGTWVPATWTIGSVIETAKIPKETIPEFGLQTLTGPLRGSFGHSVAVPKPKR